jgi:hypothetical protein
VGAALRMAGGCRVCCRISKTIRTARSRSSWGYFLRAGALRPLPSKATGGTAAPLTGRGGGSAYLAVKRSEAAYFAGHDAAYVTFYHFRVF